MTTDNSVANLRIDIHNEISRVDEKIYSGFLEHMGRAIYGGIFDPGSSLADEHGLRKDTLQAIQDIAPPLIRYPGGNYCATFHWEDGVGPLEQRKARPEPAWEGVEPNTFGTDEFMRWAKKAKIEPFLCLNMGTGTLDEALAWIEYCNFTTDTYYAQMRVKNGYPEPYHVRYIGVGNECWGPWQIEQLSKEDYAKKAYQWAKALKRLDPSLKLILCGQTGYSDWDRYVLQECIELFDYVSIHDYTASKNHYKNMFAPHTAEVGIEITEQLINLAKIVKKCTHEVKISYDEWNVWDPERAIGSKGAEEQYTLSDALAVASWLNIFIRKSDVVSIACLAQTVNVISPIMTNSTGLFLQTTYWPLFLFSKYMRGTAVSVHISGEIYTGETATMFNEPWLKTIKAGKLRFIDASAVLDEKMEYLSIALINRHLENETNICFDFLQSSMIGRHAVDLESDVEVFTVHHQDISATNSFDDPDRVKIQVSIHKLSSNFFLAKKHSFSLLRFRLTKAS